jgi:WD40 repeat protein
MSDPLDVRAVQLDLKARDLTCAFSPDRTRAVTGVVGTVARLWSVETGALLRKVTRNIVERISI